MKVSLSGWFGAGVLALLVAIKLSMWVGVAYVALHFITKYW